MKILAVNAGSSTLKWKLFNMPSAKVIAQGQIERIGLDSAVETTEFAGKKIIEQIQSDNHQEAVTRLLELLKEYQIVERLDEIKGVGHRFVNGGTVFSKSVAVNAEVLVKMEKLKVLAPLHNPANIMAIRAFKKVLPEALSVAVFDTGFHQTMPEENVIYSIPYEFYKKYHVQKFGAHGISYRFVFNKLLELTNNVNQKAKTNTILMHLGSGASICAVKHGKSIDTSMGFSPVSGITMQTRSGDVDPSLLIYLENQLGVSSTRVLDILNKESGILGISGISSDMREVFAQKDTNHRADLAVKVFINRIVKYIGSYAAELGRVDSLVFTGGIGENVPFIRRMICEQLGIFDIKLDNQCNEAAISVEQKISSTDSAVEVWTIPTNEELMIAEDVYELENN
ncbi:acetate kinase [Lactobacillus sp. UCMA15818]|uniref:acetate/propionate family kinase n=1 Tax=Lactobacillus sp. UCMA15818 TaxID=2583394 RepID=UPI0025B0F473|nr:acetate kinase [Lactobacillus sp. UCMA15818]MDN2454236.1 acetate kinase [Lactobacillus sp. UCMA15818]